ncbi:hypothetical protein WA158_001249 [Blastocystis sp. Blastoise]
MILTILLLIQCVLGEIEPRCRIQTTERYNCLPNESTFWDPKQECLRLNCCWVDRDLLQNFPSCFYPLDHGYRLTSMTPNDYGYTGVLQSNPEFPSPFIDQIDEARIEIHYETSDIFHLKIVDNKNDRYEIPIHLPKNNQSYKDINYEFLYKPSPFEFQVKRKHSSYSLFNTTNGGFTFTNQFLQLSTKLPSSVILGLGEHQGIPLSLSMEYKRIVNWPHDAPTTRGYMNLYGHHPFYMCIEPNGNAHGVLFYNSNAIEFETQPTPSLTFRSIGGIFDIYIFLGPTPDDVIRQYTSLIGLPILVPDWALGFQLCKWGYNHINNLEKLYKRMKEHHIPWDVQWTDIDIMDDSHIFTYDPVKFKGLPQYINKLHNNHIKYVGMLDPAYPSDYFVDTLASEMNVYAKDATRNASIRGYQWKNNENFLDVFHPNISSFVNIMLTYWLNLTYVDAVWLDMNEPALVVDHLYTCNANKYTYPPYLPAVGNNQLDHKTICLDSVFNDTYLHYDVHSIYGYIYSKTVFNEYKKITQKRSFVLSRSTFVGSGHYAGHWGGDNWSTWTDMKSSIWTVTMFNMYGIPYIGVDICGFASIPSTELCTRWMQLGAFYTFSRNHNFIYMPNQDPASYDPITMRRMRDILHIRYSLFPYLYTLLFNAHLNGSPVIKPLMFNYPSDPNTYSIDTQMMWANSLLISPVLKRHVRYINLYFPKGIWYNWYTDEVISSKGKFVHFPVSLDTIPLHVRGGSIFILQDPCETIFDTRRTNYTLSVYLDRKETAEGYLYMDQGETLDVVENGLYTHILYKATKNMLTITVNKNGYILEPLLDSIIIRGVWDSITTFTINNITYPILFEDNNIMASHMNMNMNNNYTIQWS